MTDDDRLSLGHGGWALWPHFILRSAGFPFCDLTDALTVDAIAPAVALATSDRLKQALLWQNPQVLALSVDWLAANADTADHRNQRRRSNEHVTVKYLQRYHTKNESVGFFGPYAWGRFEPLAGRVSLDVGPRVTGRHRTYFEDWAVDELGRAIAAEPGIDTQLPPAFAFGVVRVGPALSVPGAGLRRLAPHEAEVVRLIDGERTSAVIAGRSGQSVPVVEEVVRTLIAEGLLTRTFSVPAELGVEKTLERALRALDPGPAVTRALTALADLDAGREAVERADSSAALATAMTALDALFASLTGANATRSRGRTHIGRRLLVTQSERDLAMALSSTMVDELADPLSLVFTSARWLARRAGEDFESVAAEVHREMAPLFAEGTMPLSNLCGRLLPLMMEGRWLDGLVAELQERWQDALGLGEDDFGVSRVTRSSAELRAAVERNFSGPAPGFHAGRHHSPDVMIAATGVDAIERDDYEFVLGEMHVAMVTANTSSLLIFAPEPDLVRRYSDLELLPEQPRFVPLHIRTSTPPASGWDYPPPATLSHEYHYLSFGEGIGERDVPGRKTAAGDIVVVLEQQRPVAVFADGSRRPLLQVLGEYVAYALVSRFRMLPARRHTPRVTIDRLTVARETWRVPYEELVAPARRSETDLRADLLEVARRYGLPRHTYWRAMPRVKPIYLDLRSPHLLSVLAREVRRARGSSDAVVFSEMHPGPDQLWLPDADGRRYTSELRLTVADTTPPAQNG